MPIEFGKRLNPSWDALRARTLAGLSVLDSASSVIGGGIENKIYVWHADASTLDVFDPTETGLTTALTAAATGDTVWLPSIPIALTASITVPANVTLRGISDKASLSFSGFNGTAIVLSSGAALVLLTVSMVSNGATSIGVDNAAADTLLIHTDVHASGGSSFNIAIGQSAIVAKELWQMHLKLGTGFLLTWSNDYIFSDASNSTTWNLINSWPTGFDATSVTGYSLFSMPADGSEFYISNIGVGSGNAKIWRCTNLPAIRAAPATSPTYSVIADSSTTVGTSTLQSVTAIYYWRDRLCVIATNNDNATHYGQYQAGVWSWLSAGSGGSGYQHVTGERRMARTGAALNYSTLFNALNNAIIVQFDDGFARGSSNALWRNLTTGTRVITVDSPSAVATTIITNDAGDSLYDTGVLNKVNFSAGGSLYGASASIVMLDGETFVSADGTTFSAGPTLARGVLLDTAYAGGGAWVWIGEGADNAAISKISLDGGATYSDKTGNFWTVFGAAASGIELHGAHLVF